MFFRPACITAAICLASSCTAEARRPPAELFFFRLGPQDLESALLSVARQSGREIIFAAEAVAGKRSPPLVGRLTAEEATRRLVSGAGLSVRVDGDAIVVAAKIVDPVAPSTDDVVVTGTRIRGAAAYAPVVALSRDSLRAQGQTDLGEALRTLPQNFGGGQSPYIGLGAEDYGSDNISSGSAINLRGLGPDATLTLLNGRRLAYDGIAEGVDVSSIPLAAIDRVEVVADGTSAIYGSDAVAGVANIVLRRDVSGFQTTVRAGAATAGGDVQQQYEAVGGGRWSTGGLVATATYDRNSAVTAGQRDFARLVDGSATLVPRLRHVAGVLSGHQRVGALVEADLDVLYSRRRSYSAFPNTTTAGFRDSGVDRRPTTTSFVASPSIRFDLGAWQVTLSGNYGRDDTRYRTRFFQGGTVAALYRGSYRNQSAGGELLAEGVVVALPGGDVRLAGGAGYRWVALDGRNQVGSADPTGFSGSRESYYGFAEVNLPLVGSSNRRGGVELLSVNAAGRFEHYPRIGDIFTPKVGLLWSPIRGLDLRGTWGRSFKAPTLYQLFQGQNAFALTADAFGGANYPASATAIYAYGGNPELQPQRAASWSAGAVVSPFHDRRLTLQAGYFDVRYRDRIVAPIIGGSSVLSNPIYADLVQLNPGAAAVEALDASTQFGLFNFTGLPFDPAGVVAIIDNRNRNVAEQRLSGVDASLQWRVLAAGASRLALNAAATYLTSKQRLIAGQPTVSLAGNIFYPAHLKARASADFAHGPLSASAAVTIVGRVRDPRFTPAGRVPGQTSFDLSVGYAFTGTSGLLHGLSVQLTMLNALDDQPARIRNTVAYNTPYDATNYSPVGRLVSAAVTKRW